MNYFEVALLTYSGDESIFTYSTDKLLEIGQAVTVPLRNKQTTGIIVRKTQKPDFQTREIISTILEGPILDENLIKLAFWMSEYYCASLVSVLQTMIPKGITKKRRLIPEDIKATVKENHLELNTDQKKIYEEINKNFTKKPHLIFGVTGSGKTEIYIQLIDKVISEGKEAIILVPEISLTPQTLERFRARFGEKVVLLHSYLKETERFNNWKEIFEGKKKVIIGSRSALFAPCKNLGLIVIDEEHDPSYKQDQTPRYEAIETARMLAKIAKCGLVLGSATPKVDRYFAAKNNDIFIHKLPNRIHQSEMPRVEIVDMRNEFKFGNKSIFSEVLQEKMRKTLANKSQIILYLNRRGMSTFVSCRDCGHIESCPRCEIPLTFHYEGFNLTCHHCGFSKNPETKCPECGSFAIKYFGTGTQRVEMEIKKLFGEKVRVGRMDKDTTKKTGSHERLYKDFVQKKFDILIGTQMITKGWDLPEIGLVGIISADSALNFPDFTAAERAFDQLTQVAGRTGRGKDLGEVVIQSYQPDNPVLSFAARHDYESFFDWEIKNRKELNYPPFAHLVKLTYNNCAQEKAKSDSELVTSELEKVLPKEAKILGPSPAFIPKLNGNYFYQIIIKLSNEGRLNQIEKIQEITKNKWSIDIDPESLL